MTCRVGARAARPQESWDSRDGEEDGALRLICPAVRASQPVYESHL